jgi:hypothetical protein
MKIKITFLLLCMISGSAMAMDDDEKENERSEQRHLLNGKNADSFSSKEAIINMPTTTPEIKPITKSLIFCMICSVSIGVGMLIWIGTSY